MDIKIVTYLAMITGAFFSASLWSLQSPFFPKAATDKGLSTMQYGFVFSVYELTYLCVTPILGIYMSKIGTRILISAGLLAEAGSVIIFGCLVYIESGQQFFALSSTFRAFEAVGKASYIICAMSLIPILFPETKALKLSFYQMCYTGGMICGPAFGGVLYSFGGYLLPFAVVGGLLIIISVVILIVIPVSEQKSKQKNSPLLSTIKCLKLFEVLMGLGSIFITTLGFGFLAPTLEPRLREFNLESEILGLVFGICPALTMISAPIFGYLLDKGFDQRVFISIQAVIKAIGLCMVGPPPFIGVHSSLTFVCLGLAVNGVSNGMAVISILQFVTQVITNYLEDEDEETVKGIATSMFQTAFTLGTFVGPLFGGSMLDTIGFSWGTFILSVLQILNCITFSFMLIRKKFSDSTIPVSPNS